MARCRPCQGTGKAPLVVVVYDGRRQVIAWSGWPCDACDGSGWEHCCEGDCAQPESLADFRQKNLLNSTHKDTDV